MAMIRVQDLTFGYDGSSELLFSHASFQIDTDWATGLIGRNGRGKTTLLRLLCGELEYSGTITAPLACSYFPFPVPDMRQTAQTLAGSLVPELAQWRLLCELEQLELAPALLERPFGTLSPGERTKLLLGLLFLREDRYPLIDEPTNHLDLHGREVLSRYLREKKRFLLVSHDRAFLDGCIDHVLSINRASIEVQRGSCSSWLENRRRQDDFERAQNEKLKKEIARLEQTAREKADWADRSEREKIGFDPQKTEKSVGRRPYLAAKSKKANRRAKAIAQRQEAAIAEKSGLLRDLEKADALTLPCLQYRAETLAELRDVTVRYDGPALFRPVSFSIRRGARISLRGPNGAGKTSLLRVLTGELAPASGSVRLAGGVVISALPQDASHLSGTLAQFAAENGLELTRLLMLLRKLDLPRAQFEKRLETFSAGQKKKLLLAQSLCRPAHLYVWDEPLNYIDLLSRGQIEELLVAGGATMIFVEHDRCFCDRVATAHIELLRP